MEVHNAWLLVGSGFECTLFWCYVFNMQKNPYLCYRLVHYFVLRSTLHGAQNKYCAFHAFIKAPMPPATEQKRGGKEVTASEHQ